MKIFRIIGREGRITIPWAIRQKAGFRPDDVVSFQLMEDDSVLVRRESTCGKEKNPGAGRDAAITAFLDSLDEKQRLLFRCKSAEGDGNSWRGGYSQLYKQTEYRRRKDHKDYAGRRQHRWLEISSL